MYRNGESLPYDPPIDHPRHWMLVLTPQDQIDSCTFYHVRRSATGYDKCVEGGQSLLLSRVGEYTKLATLNREESTYVPFHARMVKSQRCQDLGALAASFREVGAYEDERGVAGFQRDSTLGGGCGGYVEGV
ncbi:hypothetical protein BJX66DRAFT_342953 [Aspergillus keveii]|uniref:Uncharacterized protein n=1 Tax=Aspergillus keveii TaxID=714993 RepID=A0ABR4FQP0_9EURO